jgi:hypothetical protein
MAAWLSVEVDYSVDSTDALCSSGTSLSQYVGRPVGKGNRRISRDVNVQPLLRLSFGTNCSLHESIKTLLLQLSLRCVQIGYLRCRVILTLLGHHLL